MNNVFLSGGFGCVTNKGLCIFVSANDLYLLQTEREFFLKRKKVSFVRLILSRIIYHYILSYIFRISVVLLFRLQ